jgi:hypothetical protein
MLAGWIMRRRGALSVIQSIATDWCPFWFWLEPPCADLGQELWKFYITYIIIIINLKMITKYISCHGYFLWVVPKSSDSWKSYHDGSLLSSLQKMWSGGRKHVFTIYIPYGISRFGSHWLYFVSHKAVHPLAYPSIPLWSAIMLPIASCCPSLARFKL